MRVSTRTRPRSSGRASSDTAKAGELSGLSAGAVTRRSAIAILAGWSVLSTARAMRVDDVRLPAAPTGSAPSLGELAERSGMTFGASIGRKALEDAVYRQLYLDHARILTSDIALKFQTLRPDQGAPRYPEADQLIDFAERNKMQFRGHTLIWNENNPEWLKALGPSEIGYWLDRHIDETVGRYAGRMHSWDVVNEPFWPDHRAPGFFRKGPWFNALGPAYIGRALKRAAAVVQRVRQYMNLGIAPFDHLAVHPDLAVAVGHGGG